MSEIDCIGMDDRQLAFLMEERNQQCMDQIYDKYSPALYGIIYQITNDKHLSEDCLMTTFVKAWNEMAAFRLARISLFTWLLNLARQSAFEAMTSGKERNSGTYNSVYAPERHCSAFELVYFKGLSVIEAAELSGMTVKELRNNIRKDLQIEKIKR